MRTNKPKKQRSTQPGHALGLASAGFINVGGVGWASLAGDGCRWAITATNRVLKMGYRIFQLQTRFLVLHRNCEAAFASIQNLCQPSPKLLLGNGKTESLPQVRNFAYVEGRAILESHTLADVLTEWRWSPTIDEEGNIQGLEFLGEKLGEENLLFNLLAPYVEAGSFIEVVGEDSKVWRWRFDGDRCFQQEGTIIFEDSSI